MTAAVVTVGLVLGTVAFASASEKSVTVSIDGKEQVVKTSGDTVADVLDDQGIDLGQHDAVAPAQSSSVSDGSRIAVSYGRKLVLQRRRRQADLLDHRHERRRRPAAGGHAHRDRLGPFRQPLELDRP